MAQIINLRAWRDEHLPMRDICREIAEIDKRDYEPDTPEEDTYSRRRSELVTLGLRLKGGDSSDFKQRLEFDDWARTAY